MKKKPGLGKLIREIFGDNWQERDWRGLAGRPIYPHLRRRAKPTSNSPSYSEIKQRIRDHLLQTPIFNKSDGDIIFFDALNERRPPKVDAERLLGLLVDEIYRFFDTDLDKAGDYLIKYLPYPHPAEVALLESKPFFLTTGIKEEAFNRTLNSLQKLVDKSAKYAATNYPLVNGKELVEPLFLLFDEHLPKLSKDTIYFSIALILKEFRLEHGQAEQIFERIKKANTPARKMKAAKKK